MSGRENAGGTFEEVVGGHDGRGRDGSGGGEVRSESTVLARNERGGQESPDDESHNGGSHVIQRRQGSRRDFHGHQSSLESVIVISEGDGGGHGYGEQSAQGVVTSEATANTAPQAGGGEGARSAELRAIIDDGDDAGDDAGDSVSRGVIENHVGSGSVGRFGGQEESEEARQARGPETPEPHQSLRARGPDDANGDGRAFLDTISLLGAPALHHGDGGGASAPPAASTAEGEVPELRSQDGAEQQRAVGEGQGGRASGSDGHQHDVSGILAQSEDGVGIRHRQRHPGHDRPPLSAASNASVVRQAEERSGGGGCAGVKKYDGTGWLALRALGAAWRGAAPEDRKRAAIMASLLALAMITVMWRMLSAEPPPLPLATVLAAPACLPVSEADLAAGTAYGGRFDLVRVRRSMATWMESEKLSGISAMHLGVPLCLMLVRTTGENADGPPHEMFNVNITGNSRAVVPSPETSQFCPGGARAEQRLFVPRYLSIFIEYMTPKGERIDRLYITGTEAAVVQHLYGVEHNHVICSGPGAATAATASADASSHARSGIYYLPHR